MRPADWLPPVLWMGVIVWFSADTASAEHTGRLLMPVLRRLLPWAAPGTLDTLHGLIRKGAHLAEYALLATLWYRALTRGRRLTAQVAGWFALAISLAWALLDEWHQAFQPSRTGSAVDVAIDGAGAALAVVAACRGWRPVLDGATAFLLWLAAAGGGAAIALNAWADVPSGALWIATPAALLLLVARARLRRRTPGARGRGDAQARVRP